MEEIHSYPFAVVSDLEIFYGPNFSMLVCLRPPSFNLDGREFLLNAVLRPERAVVVTEGHNH